MNQRRWTAGVCSVVLAGAVVLAQPMIDQEQVNVDTGSTYAVGGASEQKLAQVFTAGLSGKLTYVTVPVTCDPAATLTVTIEKTSGGVPIGSVLALETIAGSNFPTIVPSPAVGFRIVRFSNPPAVTAGTSYAVVLEAGKDSCGLYHGPAGDTYGGGAAFFDARPNPPGWVAITPVLDLAFQTFVE